MTLHRGMSSAEFIEYLRSWAINGNAKEIVIELIDQLGADNDAANDLEARDQELYDAQEAILDLVGDHTATLEHLGAMIEMARMSGSETTAPDTDAIDDASRQLKLLKRQIKKYGKGDDE